MIPLIAGIVSSLISANMPRVAQAVVDKGLGYVEEKLGLEIKPQADGMLSPEQVFNIRQASLKHEEFLIEQEYKNTADARAMQVAALNQDDIYSKRFVYYLATFWSLCSVIYIYMITFSTIPTANVRFADTILGFLLGTIVATIVNYFFGSSRSSAMKNEIIKEAQNASTKN